LSSPTSRIRRTHVVIDGAGVVAVAVSPDLRASGTTEARDAAAPIDDVKKMIGHTARSETTEKVYDRAKLAANRRIAAARNAHRNEK